MGSPDVTPGMSVFQLSETVVDPFAPPKINTELDTLLQQTHQPLVVETEVNAYDEDELRGAVGLPLINVGS